MGDPTANQPDRDSGSSSAGVVLFDLTGRVTMINAEAAYLLGIERGEAAGLTAGQLVKLCAGDAENLARLIHDFLARPNLYAGQTHYTRIAVDERSIAADVSEAWGADGPSGVVSTLRELAPGALSQDEKDELIRLIWFDLKSPLASAEVALEIYLHDMLGVEVGDQVNETLAASGSSDDITAQQRQVLSILHLSLSSLRKIIDRSFELLLVTFGVQDLDLQPVDIRTLIDDVIESCTLLYDNRYGPVQIHRTIPAEEIPAVHGDARKLRHVMDALITEAGRSRPDNETVSVSLSTENEGVSIRVAAVSSDTSVQRPVVSQGQSARLTRRANPLGWPILDRPNLREIIERHHGRISVESSAEQGTIFSVWLPYEQ